MDTVASPIDRLIEMSVSLYWEVLRRTDCNISLAANLTSIYFQERLPKMLAINEMTDQNSSPAAAEPYVHAVPAGMYVARTATPAEGGVTSLLVDKMLASMIIKLLAQGIPITLLRQTALASHIPPDFGEDVGPTSEAPEHPQP